ncbi:MAG: CASC3 protein CASC3 [Eggerthellaceae bacterium]|nr:CASC3 protein CASC3 [Eggerthellaceae bacterium]
MAKTNKKANKQRSNLTRQQKADRLKAAQEREKRAKEKAEAAARTKKILIIVVCVILVLALGIPTMALTLFAQ